MQPSPGQSSGDAGVIFTAGVTFTAEEIALYQTLSPLPAVPADPTNAHADDPAAASLGQMLYFDASYSGPLKVASDLGNVGDTGRIACFTCHWGPYLDDQRSSPRNVSLGADYHGRNASTTINSAYYRWSNWGGRFSAQWELPLAVAESGVIMNSSRLEIAHLLFDRYRTQYEAVFGALDAAIGSDGARFPAQGKPKPAPTTATPSPPDGPWELMADADRATINRIFTNYGKALEAYLRLLVSRNAPFDVFASGKNDAIGDDAKRGLQLFVGRARCINCHLGPHFSDDAFHNLGLPQTGANVPASDDGRFKDIPPLLASPFSSGTQYSDDTTTGRLLGLTNPPPAAAKGQFRTPSLRGVAQTAPYMHSGQLATLEEVIDFFDRGGQAPVSGTLDPLLVQLHLSAQDKADLLAFLQTLTGEPVPPGLMMASSGPWP